jgi:hypothetical protein
MMINLVLILLLVLIITTKLFQETFVLCPPNSTEMLALNSFETPAKSQCVLNDPNDYFADLENNGTEDLVCIGKYLNPVQGVVSEAKAWCAKKND